jgi:hypothetical protein
MAEYLIKFTYVKLSLICQKFYDALWNTHRIFFLLLIDFTLAFAPFGRYS